MNKKVHCENCEKEFIAYSVFKPITKEHFCSWECFKEYRGY